VETRLHRADALGYINPRRSQRLQPQTPRPRQPPPATGLCGRLAAGGQLLATIGQHQRGQQHPEFSGVHAGESGSRPKSDCYVLTAASMTKSSSTFWWARRSATSSEVLQLCNRAQLCLVHVDLHLWMINPLAVGSTTGNALGSLLGGNTPALQAHSSLDKAVSATESVLGRLGEVP